MASTIFKTRLRSIVKFHMWALLLTGQRLVEAIIWVSPGSFLLLGEGSLTRQHLLLHTFMASSRWSGCVRTSWYILPRGGGPNSNHLALQCRCGPNFQRLIRNQSSQWRCAQLHALLWGQLPHDVQPTSSYYCLCRLASVWVHPLGTKSLPLG